MKSSKNLWQDKEVKFKIPLLISKEWGQKEPKISKITNSIKVMKNRRVVSVVDLTTNLMRSLSIFIIGKSVQCSPNVGSAGKLLR